MFSKVTPPSLPSGPKPVAEPEKELRFTRAAQGHFLLSISVILLAIGITLFATSTAPGSPENLWMYATPTCLLGILLIIPAMRCIRHAYIILSPLGIEIFPFFKPEKNLQILYWSDISHAELSTDEKQLIIHTNEARTAGVVASLTPVKTSHRPLLARAISGTMEKRKEHE